VHGGGAAVSKETVTGAEGEALIDYRPQQVGAYRIRASAELGGRRTSDEALVLVEPVGQEEREIAATPALLKQISEATGGRYLGQAGSLPALPLREPRVLHVNWRKDIQLWSRWWYFAVCVLLLGLEWSLRRRHGYL
jgi:hypothetical protein